MVADGPEQQTTKGRWPLLFVTGMSGAGKTTALQAFEDLGLEVIDNLPLAMLPALLDRRGGRGRLQQVVGLDVRGQGFDVETLLRLLKESREGEAAAGLLFLDCSDEVLVQRFSATRRPHPLAADRRPAALVREERRLLAPLHNIADMVVDTSGFGGNDLRAEIMRIFGPVESAPLLLTITSFGYAHGVPHEADLMFDMRFLRNPHWVPELRSLNGQDERVSAYVFGDDAFRPAFEAIMQLLHQLLPAYVREGRSYLSIAFGCTGGQHRSVATAELASKWLTDHGWENQLLHRELAHLPDRQGG